jgi:hypothetical protein
MIFGGKNGAIETQAAQLLPEKGEILRNSDKS